MAIQIVGTTTEITSPASTSVGFVDGNHTTTSDTDLLIVCVAIEGNDNLEPSNPIRFDISGTNTALTLISDSGAATDGTDVRSYVYGLISPDTIDPANCRVDVQFSTNQIASVWINLSGTNTGSVAAATNDLETVNNESAGSTTVFASAGSTGNGLLVWGAAHSNDMKPSDADNSFIEQVDNVTAATSSDFAYNLSTLLAGAPSAVTLTWNTTNENAGNLIEIIPATSTSLLPGYTGIGRGVMRGVGRGT